MKSILKLQKQIKTRHHSKKWFFCKKNSSEIVITIQADKSVKLALDSKNSINENVNKKELRKTKYEKIDHLKS